ncbi:hypothetical protein CAMRE0001_0755 [Campylobacter rectus RM3267]|uniref:Uncharacterized protein n=1 Tax=Campylobacter rectus RM3267 TaxID=553218 RepID=B9CZR3_CAMRE|nr:hypothetical protein CAMRE0001_0755 [Campylobacter rectus RM3267]
MWRPVSQASLTELVKFSSADCLCLVTLATAKQKSGLR